MMFVKQCIQGKTIVLLLAVSTLPLFACSLLQVVEAVLHVTKVSHRNKQIVTAQMLRDCVNVALNVKVGHTFVIQVVYQARYVRVAA
jgi:hypothetical protein